MKKLIMFVCFAIAMAGISCASFNSSKILQPFALMGRLVNFQSGVSINKSIFASYFYSIHTTNRNSIASGIDIYVQ